MIPKLPYPAISRTTLTTTLHNSGLVTAALVTLLFIALGCNAKPDPVAAATPAASTPATASTSAKDPVTITSDADTNKHPWTSDQILTCTVSQCWQLSGKNEDSFFDIVQQLAAISAKNRDLTLPQTEAAGQKTGEFIKSEARKDHDALLYAVVDAAIRKVGTPNQAN